MFTNADIKEYSEILFAHGPAYYLPQAVTRRDDEKNAIVNGLKQHRDGVVIILSELQGSGKSFILKSVREDLRGSGLVAPEERILYTSVDFDIRTLSQHKSDSVLIIDEMDKKYRAKVSQLLDEIPSRLGTTLRRLVLSGDYMLKDEDRLATLRRRSLVEFVDLEPLSEAFFLEAMEKRAAHEPGTRSRARSTA